MSVNVPPRSIQNCQRGSVDITCDSSPGSLLWCGANFESHARSALRGVEIGKSAAVGPTAAHQDVETHSLRLCFARVAIRNAEAQVIHAFSSSLEKAALRTVTLGGLAELDLHVRD